MTEAERWQRKPLNDVAEAAINQISADHMKAEIELQRRLIQELYTYSEAAAKATKVLIVLTVVLVAPAIVQIVV